MDLRRGPGFVQVVLEPPHGAALQNRRRGGPVAPFHQQPALSLGEDPVGMDQQVGPGHLRHPLIRDDEGDALTLVLEALEFG